MKYTITERKTKTGKVNYTIHVEGLTNLSPADEALLSMYIKQGYKVVEKKATKKRDSKPENSLTKESMLAMLKADKLDNLYKKYEEKIAKKENFMKMKKVFLEDMKKAILAELTEKKPDRLSYYSEAFSKKGASILSIREEYKKEFYS